MGKTIALVMLMTSSFALGAIPGKKTNFTEKKLLKKDIDAALLALELPPTNRLQALKNLEPKTYELLVKITQRPGLSLTSQWRAVVQLGTYYPQRSRHFLLKLSRSKDWYFRNASLLSLKVSAPKTAIIVAERLLNDSALVVRTAAVQTLFELKSKKSISKLWKSLDSRENFRKGKSLWVRAHIMRALAEFAGDHEIQKFARYLNDKDKKVQVWAVRGIERITGTQKQNRGLALKQRRKLWKSKLL